MQCLDIDCDGQLSWSEFLVYLKWGYTSIPRVLIDVVFQKGLIPAMRDNFLRQKETKLTKEF
ncbi:hypothetical protein MAR_011868 [Mya arenaria]|uniref:EF-hand domain-containing protein n=1 Tax=Mya arenaria TaxID=6604 RepID=A0ABY7FYZ9_MYAAR|nr:hypothetical protein MAR_011868 [Mya arenaria]